MVLGWKLRQLGFDVQECSNGAEALKLVGRVRPDLIISDYQMPGVDGLEMCQELAKRTECADIPILLLTGRGHRVDPAILARTNIQIVMSKPFSPNELIEKVKGLVAESDGSSDLRRGPIVA